MGQWYFNLYHPGDKKRNPIQGEFFSSEAISDPGRALVREGIQNSLDAAVGDGPVLIRIFVSGHENAKEYRAVDGFFAASWDHFRAPGNGLRECPKVNGRCEFLVFEDFGTSGLTGDPSELDPVPGSRNAFFHFFRAEGISDKSEGDRGRWGVGKTVFQRASHINTMFGLTVRNDDRQTLLMGVSVLKGHRINGRSFTPDGWFGVKPNGGAVMPLDNRAVLAQFREAFSIKRGTEPGLSIVVPWLDDEVTPRAIVDAVMRDYFYPILTGRLKVIVEAPGVGITVDKDSLDTELNKIGGDLEQDLRPLIELARWSLEQDAGTIPKLIPPDPRKGMQWDAALVPEGLDKILSVRYMANERVAARVPVNIREKGKPTRESYFDVFMVRDGSDRSDRPVFVREQLIIPDVRAPRSRGMTALVIAEHGPLAAFLGDSENPSHTQWQHDGSNFKGKYTSGKTDLQFVERSVRELVRLITESESEEDRNLLADFFNLPGEDLSEKKSPIDKPGPDTDKPRPPAQKKRLFNVARRDGGFVITAAGSAGYDDLPPCIEVQTAYEVRRGNAFSKYKAEDFDFADGGFAIDAEDATLVAKRGNQLVVKLNGRDFRVAVKGFDERRDVRVRVSRLEECNAGPLT